MSKTTIIVDNGNVSVPASEPGKSEKANNSHGFLKFLSVLLFAVFVAALFVPKYYQFGSGGGFMTGSVAAKDQSVFALILANIQSFFNDKLSLAQMFKLMSAHKTAWFLGACAVVLLVSTIITLCCKKASASWFGIDCGILTIVGLPYAYKCLHGDVRYIDLFLIVCALALILLIITAFTNGGKKNILPVICFVALSVLMVLTCMYNFFPRTDALYKNSASLFVESARVYFHIFKQVVTGGKISSFQTYEIWAYVMFGVLLVCWILTVFQLATVKRTTWFSVIRYLALCGVAVASMILVLTTNSLTVNIKDYPYYIIVVAVAFVVFLICLIAKLSAKKKAKAAKAEKTQQESEKQSEEASSVAVATNEAAAPAYNAPAYSAPVYSAPVYAAPVYGAPTYGAPTYGTPSYGQPANSVSGHDRNARMAPNSQTSRQNAAGPLYANGTPAPMYPMPNIYININNGANGTPAEIKVSHEEAKPAVQTAVVTTAPSVEEPVEEKTEETVDVIAQEILEEEKEAAPAPLPAPTQKVAVRETTVVAKKKKTRRSFWLFLGLLLTVAALAIYAITDWNAVTGLFSGFAFKAEVLLPLAFLCGGVLAVVFGLISLASANKPCGVLSFIFTVVLAVTYLLDVQLNGDTGIVKSITGLDWKFIAIALCAIFAVIFSFIGAVRTGKRKATEAVTEKKVVSTVEKAAELPAEKTEKTEKTEKAVVVSAEPPVEEVEEAEEEPVQPEEELDDPFIKTLSVLNKREFKKLFLEGNPPSYLPEYEIGGDNTDFFDAIFVYLGKIRSVISPSLLAAMYDYMNP